MENDHLKNQTIEAAYKWRKSVESGDLVIVGVNKYVTDEPDNMKVFEPDPEAEKRAIAGVIRHRRERDNDKTQAALDELRAEAIEVRKTDTGGEVMNRLVAAAHADATIGEMHAVLM